MRQRRIRTALLCAVAALLFGCQAGEGAPEADRVGELFAAARAGELEQVRELIESGLPVDAEDRYGATALLMAAGNGHVEVVEWLLGQGADPDHQESFYGGDALQTAVFSGHLDVAAVLLRGGADNREAALHAALSRQNVELAQAAVESGPIYESELPRLRVRAASSPELTALLERAQTRPDPDPPTLTEEELRRYAGNYEGVTSETTALVDVRDGKMWMAIDGAEALALAPVAENGFASKDESVQASFWGRGGTIEAIQLRLPRRPLIHLRHSVAEPVGASAYNAPPEVAAAADKETVNWPSFRGTNATGIGDGADVPTTWDAGKGENVMWQADLKGLGNSSPVVWGDRVFVTTAVAESIPQLIQTGLTGSGNSVDENVEHAWKVLAFDKWSGETLWETEVGRRMPLTRRHFKSSQANSTPVTDGEHVVVVFPTAGMACLGVDGEIHWGHELGGLNAGAFTDPGVEWGYASSPILYGSRAIVQVDVHDGQYLAAWELADGKQAWRVERDVAPSWATPVVLSTDDGDELIANGSTIHGYDPDDGRELWSLGPNSELVIAAPVVGEGVVYVSAGYAPVKPIYAVRAGARGDLEVDPNVGDEHLLWSHARGGAYMPTPLLYRGIYYVVHHNGRLVAYDAQSGEAIYKTRFSQGGVFTASPVAVNGKIYMPTEEGHVYVIEAGPEYNELAVNEMKEPLMATPAVSEGILLIRTPTRLVAVSERRVAGLRPAG